MVVGDDHGQPARLGVRNAFEAGDAGIDGHQHLGVLRAGEFDECRREPVAHAEAVRHHVADLLRTQRPETADADCDAGRAIAVVVSDDDDALAALDRVGEQSRGGVDALEPRGRQQGLEIERQLLGRHAPCGVEPAQQWRQVARQLIEGGEPAPAQAWRSRHSRIIVAATTMTHGAWKLCS